MKEEARLMRLQNINFYITSVHKGGKSVVKGEEELIMCALIFRYFLRAVCASEIFIYFEISTRNETTIPYKIRRCSCCAHRLTILPVFQSTYVHIHVTVQRVTTEGSVTAGGQTGCSILSKSMSAFIEQDISL